MLPQAEADTLALPREHPGSIGSTSTIERVEPEVDRRAKLVGVFPNSASLLQLATAVLQHHHDE